MLIVGTISQRKLAFVGNLEKSLLNTRNPSWFADLTGFFVSWLAVVWPCRFLFLGFAQQFLNGPAGLRSSFPDPV
uniref:Uncharacterized protein n=1 Tax=uncultured planctomycete 8FN TaxID=455070 RepID=A9LH27_9BACT|nr:hypothetical protein 8FN_26 [uncultured planctomycete 8FN]